MKIPFLKYQLPFYFFIFFVLCGGDNNKNLENCEVTGQFLFESFSPRRDDAMTTPLYRRLQTTSEAAKDDGRKMV
jgi:hypothetical protein